MPDWRYSEFDPLKSGLKDLLRQLQEVFNDLLLQTNGDVEEALRYLDRIGKRHGVFNERFTIDDFRRFLEDQRTIATDRRGQVSLTGKGERMLRTESLDAIFGSLEKGGQGDHRVPAPGEGGERLPETRPWAFGDSISLLDAGGTLQNALRRAGIDDIDITEQDMRVHETESLSSCATVLLVDISHSMVLYGEDRITPAKRVALALTELIRTRYPKDSLHVVLFGDEAEEVPLESLPYVGVGPFHTNTRAGLRMAQEILRRSKQGNRQIFMLTDGKPSVITERDGQLYKNPFGLDERIVNKTLEEAAQCRRLGIPVTTFMLTDDPVLVKFIEDFTEVNHGRAYFSRPDEVGGFVLVDFIRNRRREVR